MTPHPFDGPIKFPSFFLFLYQGLLSLKENPKFFFFRRVTADPSAAAAAFRLVGLLNDGPRRSLRQDSG